MATLPKLKRTKPRPASGAEKRKTRQTFKKGERTSDGEKYKLIMSDPKRKLNHLRLVTLQGYQAWLKSAQKKAKTATGAKKAELMRKIEKHKLSIKKTREKIRAVQKELAAAAKKKELAAAAKKAKMG